MKKTDAKKLYKKAWDKWGIQLQLIMLMEECSELIKASSKVLRKHQKENSCWRNFVEEIADVEIMIDQMKTMCDFQKITERVETAKHDKLLKLKEMLESSKKQGSVK